MKSKEKKEDNFCVSCGEMLSGDCCSRCGVKRIDPSFYFFVQPYTSVGGFNNSLKSQMHRQVYRSITGPDVEKRLESSGIPLEILTEPDSMPGLKPVPKA